MTQNKHTPGPIEAINEATLLELAICNVHPVEIARITDCRDTAQELLEALEEALRLLDNVTASTDVEAEYLGQAENIMSTAVAKARGQQ